MTVGSLPLLLLAALACVAVGVIGRGRRVGLLLALGTFLLFAAAADVRVALGSRPTVAVLVDASASTRGFWFRDRSAVSSIAASLAPGATFGFFTFADGDLQPLAPHSEIADRPGDRTTLPAIDADAVLLFSDGRFETAANTTTPIYPVLRDEVAPTDARITGVESSADRSVVTVENDGPPRVLTFADGVSVAVPTGASRLAHAGSTAGTIRLDTGDRWPENDSVEVGAPIAIATEQWWIGASPPSGFRAINVAATPPADAWLAARVVVMDDLPAASIPPATVDAVARYVRDLGGSLVLVGGSHSFSAGGYGGTALDALSPLASESPSPQRDWLILIDSSGSMAGRAADGRSRLDHAVEAADAIAGAIPKNERIAVANFARDVVAWPARDDRRVVAPADLAANGPTNLRAAIDNILRREHDRPMRAIVLTDGQADLGDATALRDSLRSAHVALDWIALDAPAAGTLATLATDTGGVAVAAGDPMHWSAAAVRRIRDATATPALPGPIALTWRGPLSDIGTTDARDVNLTFVRDGVEPLADDGQRPLAARWRVGTGTVTALAFAAPASIVQRVADLVGRQPRDPRFTVRWLDDRVIVEAAEGGRTMDGLAMRLRQLRDGDAVTDLPFAQIAPGPYEAALSPSTSPRIVTVAVANQMIDGRTIPGLPAAEFRAIGVDRTSLAAIAVQSGGRIIIDDGRSSASISLPRRERSITTPLLIAAIIALGGALAYAVRRPLPRSQQKAAR